MSDLDQLLRWESSGGTWRVVGRTPPVVSTLVISLCRCDGGEEMDRLTTGESTVLAYVGRRETSEDPESETTKSELAD